MLPFTYKTRHIRSKRYNRNILPCVHHFSMDVTREHRGCIPIQSVLKKLSVRRGSNITQLASALLKKACQKKSLSSHCDTDPTNFVLEMQPKYRQKPPSIFGCTCKGSVWFKTLTEGARSWDTCSGSGDNRAYFAQLHPCCCTWFYFVTTTVDKLYRESSCCIVGSWTCFSFLKTFHFSSKRLLQFQLTGEELAGFQTEKFTSAELGQARKITKVWNTWGDEGFIRFIKHLI